MHDDDATRCASDSDQLINQPPVPAGLEHCAEGGVSTETTSLEIWLASGERIGDFPIPSNLVAISDLITRFRTHHLGRARPYPWEYREADDKVRHALMDDALDGWLLTDAGTLEPVSGEKWCCSPLWERASTGQLERPEVDYDGNEVSDRDWAPEIEKSGPPGIYVLKRGDVRRWLSGAPRDPHAAAAASRERLIDAFKKHLRLDCRVNRDDVVSEVAALLKLNGISSVSAKEVADAVRSPAHRKGGRPSDNADEAAQTWIQEAAARRSEFRVPA